ncbi:MAG: hypothetical protein R6V45_07960 [Oceanipulchritudo sp.]
MKSIKQICLLSAGLVTLGLTSVSAEAFLRERTESFPAGPGKSLRIDAASGQLEIRPGAPGVIVLNVLMHAKAGSEEKAAKAFDSMDFQFEDREGSLTLEIESRGHSWFGFFKTTPRPEITVIAECPPSTDLNLDTGSGDILVEGIKGNIRPRQGLPQGHRQ